MSTAQVYFDAQPWSKEEALYSPPSSFTPRPWLERVIPAAFSVGLLGVDAVLTLGAFVAAYWLRFVVPDATTSALGIESYVRTGAAVATATCCLLALNGLYDKERPLSWGRRAQGIVSSVSTALVLVVALAFVLGDQAFSRLWFAVGWALAVVGLAAWRALAQRLYTGLRDLTDQLPRVLIVGANPLGQQLARELADGYRVMGFVDNGSDLRALSEVPLLGAIAQLEQIVNTLAIDELVIALPDHRRPQVSSLIARGFHRRVQVRYLPDLAEIMPREVQVQHLGGRPYIGFASSARVSWLKRAADLVFASIGLLIAAPLLLGIALLIKLDSPGPVFYGQVRVGKHGRHFRMLKFRSMRRDADRLLDTLAARNEASGPLFKMRNDPRVTRVGRVLRRLSLDELPQIFNVLRGEMSLVGPRPPLPSEVAKYEDWQIGRLRAVPGMTGLWQVSGRSEVPFHDMVRLDLHYIRNWSFALDLEILLRTIPAVLASRGAY